jgi:hypothetical protein
MLEENSMSNINNKDKPGKYDTEEKRLAKMHMNSLFMFAISSLLVWYSFKTNHKIEGIILTVIPAISLFVAYRTRAEKKK